MPKCLWHKLNSYHITPTDKSEVNIQEDTVCILNVTIFIKFNNEEGRNKNYRNELLLKNTEYTIRDVITNTLNFTNSELKMRV